MNQDNFTMTSEIRVSLKENIAEYFQPTYNSKHTLEVDHGGRCTTKTTKNAIKIIQYMLQYPQLEVVVFRENFAHHRASTMKALIRVMKEVYHMQQGVDYFIHLSPLSISLATGNYIHFGMMSDYEKMKGYEPTPGNFIGILWLFEATEFKGGQLYVEQAKSTYIRGQKPIFKILVEFNTAEHRNNWTYDWLDQVRDEEDTIIRFSTYQNLTPYEQEHWLGEQTIKSIEQLQRLDFKLYEFVYLGIPRVLQGACHPNFDRNKHVKPLDFEPTEICVGIDFGVNDAVVVQVGYFLGITRVHTSTLYYHSNRKTREELDIEDYVDQIVEVLVLLANTHQQLVEVRVDSANKVLTQLLNKHLDVHPYLMVQPVSKTKIRKETSSSIIQERIDCKNLLIQDGRYSVDPKSGELILELESSKYHPVKGTRLDNEVYTVDTLDADDYMLSINIGYMIDDILGGIDDA